MKNLTLIEACGPTLSAQEVCISNVLAQLKQVGWQVVSSPEDALSIDIRSAQGAMVYLVVEEASAWYPDGCVNVCIEEEDEFQIFNVVEAGAETEAELLRSIQAAGVEAEKFS